MVISDMRLTPHHARPRRLLTRFRLWRLALAGVCIGAASCTAPRPPLVVSDPDPSVKIPAIEVAVRDKDRKAIRQMVQDLDNDDPAVRFYAIQGLHRLTGESFGYRYYDDDVQRAPAVRKWKEWLAGSEKASPATTRP